MRSIFFTTLIAFTIVISGCGGGETANSTANSSAANANASNTSPHGPLSTTKKPEAETTNNAPNLTPVVVTYYEALKKKDDAQFRSVLTQAFIKNLEADMKADKETGSLVAYVAKTESIPEQPIEVRNEQITGSKGVAEVRGGVYKTWTPFAFALENGKWKLTGGSSDLDAVQQPANK